MVFRYWGDAHADVQQFAPLVDRRAGGIRNDTLAGAIQAKGWQTALPPGSLNALRIALDARQPVILLIEDRPARYHFVVAVGLTDRAVIVHDPTWGPNRAIGLEELTRVWGASRSWMLVVTPATAVSPPRTDAAAPPTPSAPRSACDIAMDAALDTIEARGLDAADAALAAARPHCAGDARPARELAGVRLAQSRAAEAVALSREALQIDPSDRYAWNVLGSGLFLQNAVGPALEAWNHAGKPQLDSVQIRGLQRTRYALVAQLTGLTPNTLLTPRNYTLAQRRLEQLPDRLNSGVALLPSTDGYATVVATLHETTRVPHGAIPWAAAAIQTAINREIVAPLAGRSGQGEMWTVSWRWWENRPRVAGSFAAPRTGPLGGIWRVEGIWEKQAYDTGGTEPVRESRRTGLLAWRNWLTGTTRADLRSGLDTWNGSRRAVVTGGTVEQRLFADRLTVTGSYDRWFSIADSPGFAAAAATAAFRSSPAARGLVAVASARVDAASASAPLALWSGAGEGRGRPGLIRAHRMLYDGIIDAAIFGRRSGVANLELQRWFTTPRASVAVAVFTDLGAASHRLPGAPDKGFQADIGGGLRGRVPGQPGTFRLDYAHGAADGANRISAGWNVEY